VAAAVLSRCDELRDAMADALRDADDATSSEQKTRCKRKGFILYKLEEELVRTWGVVANRRVFEQHVAAVVWKHLLHARRWQEELDAISATDTELRALWVAFKGRSLALSKIDRRIYENVFLTTASADDTPWELRTEPHWLTLAFAVLVCVVCAAAPIAYLILYASDVGQQQTLAFFVDVAFEIIIIFLVVLPLQIWVQFVVFPAMVVEKIAKDSDAAPGAYPYETPLNEDALDYLLEEVPAMHGDLRELASPVKKPLNLRDRDRFADWRRSQRRQRAKGGGLEDDAGVAVVPQRRDNEKQHVTLEDLEDIYGEMTWRPLWTTSLAFVVAQFYMFLPAALQEIALEETLLFIPVVAFGATRQLIKMQEGRFASLIMLFAAIAMGWLLLAVLGYFGSAVHSKAHRTRRKQQERHQRSLVVSTPPSSEKTTRAWVDDAETDDDAVVHCEESLQEDDDDPQNEGAAAPQEEEEGPPTPRSPFEADLHLHEMVGSTCLVVGLQARRDLNGREGSVEAYLEDQQRFRVIVDGAAYALKPKNLERSHPSAIAWKLASRG